MADDVTISDSPGETPETPKPDRVLGVLVAVLLSIFAALLFCSVVVAPLNFRLLGGIIGVNAVLIHSAVLAAIAAWYALMRTSKLLSAEVSVTPTERSDIWARVGMFLVFLIFLNAFVIGSRGLTSWGVVIGHDEPEYFSFLHSWVFDRDVKFEDEYKMLPGAWESFSKDYPDQPDYNVAPVGTPLIWLPFYLAALALLGLLHLLGAPVPIDGMSAPYAFAAAFGSHVEAWIGMALMYRALRLWFSPRSSFFTVMLLWMASPLLWYLTEQPWMSHAASYFAVALVFWWWAESRGRRSVLGWIALGAAIGLTVLVRPNYIVLLILPASDLVTVGKNNLGRSIAMFTLLTITMALCTTPQIATYISREDWLHKGIHFPPGSPMQWAHPAILEVLFSAHHGLFPWHPILLFGFLGIPFIWRRSSSLMICVALVLAIDVYMNAAIEAWWAGGSFGMRRMVGTMPLMAPGLAAFGSWAIQTCRKRPALPVSAVAAIAFIYNITLVRQIREGYTDTLGPVPFSHVWTQSAILFHDMFGNPATYPASLWFGLKHRVPPGQYDVLGGWPASPELKIEGLDLRSYLGSGWNRSINFASQNNDGFLASSGNCTLLFNLAWGDAYTIKLALAPPTHMETDQNVSFDLNGYTLGSARLEKHTRSVLTLNVPKEAVHHGLNTLGLHFERMLIVNRKGVRGEPGGAGFPMDTSFPLPLAGSVYSLEIHRVKPGEPAPAPEQKNPPAPSPPTAAPSPPAQ